MKLKLICFLIVLCAVVGILPQGSDVSVSAATEQPVRGVWAATVYALDYPSAYSTSDTNLKKDIDNLLNNVQKMNYNALFFQVRPAGDAFYKSDIFPWSKYLTGTQGVAPENGFDPLEYLTSEAHKRGIDVHAWINPYRITASGADNDKLSEDAVSEKYPSLVVKHTDGKLYLNPGVPDANKLVVDGALEIVRNYNVDGIHIDDYFYPGADFPDSDTFAKYGSGYSDIGDWRRDNITGLIKSLKTAIKNEKADVIFSVSPFGIWANKSTNPGGSDTKGSQSYYDDYADSKRWVKEGLVDWIIPQVYWNIGHSAADFEAVSKWWASVVSGTDVKLCIGQGVYNASDETKTDGVWYGQKGIEELKKQNKMIKSFGNYGGYVHYRLGSLLKSSALGEYALNLNNATMAEGVANQNSGNQGTPETPPLNKDEAVTPPQTSEEQVKDENKENAKPPQTSVDVEDEKEEEKEPAVPSQPSGDAEAEKEEVPQKPPITGSDSGATQKPLFSDLPKAHWAADAITELYNKGIVKGMNDGSFGCARKVIRADFTIMLVRILGKDAKVLRNFSDVTPDKYYYHEIGVARVMGITNGRDGVIFDPNGNISREDMATMVFRVLEKENKLNYDENINLNSRFSDAARISPYAVDAVTAMTDMGLLSGYETGEFQPKGIATRAEMAVFLNRVAKLFD